MPTDRPASTADGDRERVSRARQAAEELFKPKRQAAPAAAHAFANASPAAEEPARRQPRIIMVPPLVPVSVPNKELPAAPRRPQRRVAAKREAPEIPSSQFGRIRALTNYGMTTAQVAKLYGVPTGVIDRIVGSVDGHR